VLLGTPSFAFLTDLYTHSLLTVGDDEFFSGLSAPTRANAPCNPLTELDEITSISEILEHCLHAVLERRPDSAQDGYVPGFSIKWDGMRRKLTRFLQLVHT